MGHEAGYMSEKVLIVIKILFLDLIKVISPDYINY